MKIDVLELARIRAWNRQGRSTQWRQSTIDRLLDEIERLNKSLGSSFGRRWGLYEPSNDQIRGSAEWIMQREPTRTTADKSEALSFDSFEEASDYRRSCIANQMMRDTFFVTQIVPDVNGRRGELVDSKSGEWRCGCPSDPAFDRSMNPPEVKECGRCGFVRPYARGAFSR